MNSYAESRLAASVKSVAVAILTATIAASVASADVEDWIHVPSTISPEAQSALRSLAPQFLEMKVPASDDSEAWSQLQQALEKEERAENQASKATFTSSRLSVWLTSFSRFSEPCR